jgi:rhodanese-related sulfurtransferase
VAVDLMKKAGFTNLYNLDGGLIDWSASGLPLVK